MNGINWILNLQARYESLNGATKAVEKMEQTTQRATRTVGAATQDLVNRLSPLQDTFSKAFTDAQADSAMNKLEKSMSRLGLVWTSAVNEGMSADLLAKNSLQQLAEQGFITANASATSAHTQKAEAAALKAEAAAAKQAEREQKALARAEREAEREAARHQSVLSRLGGTLGRMHTPLDSVTKKVTKMALSFFTVRKLLRYLINAIGRAPERIGGSLTKLKTQITDGFARVTVSALAGMQKGIDRLRAALDSPGGQRLMRGLETAARITGQAIGWLVEKVAVLVEWLGNHFTQAITVAAVAMTFFAAKALVAAAATLAANLPLVLIIATTGLLVTALLKAGVTAEQIFKGIGATAGWLYALVYNLVADAWNVIATFGEFLANVWNDPLSATAHLFIDTFDVILGVVETAAKAIDTLLGTNMGNAVAGFRGKMQAWADSFAGEKKITIARMTKLDNTATASAWGNSAAGVATKFSLSSLDAQTPQAIKGIKSDTGAIRKSVSMAEEDLKSLVDMAERRFVAQFNLQHLAPQITVNGANTGNTVADAEAIAESIKRILIEQTASSAYISTAMP